VSKEDRKKDPGGSKQEFNEYSLGYIRPSALTKKQHPHEISTATSKTT
jgi:hypothetical protein